MQSKEFYDPNDTQKSRSAAGLCSITLKDFLSALPVHLSLVIVDISGYKFPFATEMDGLVLIFSSQTIILNKGFS